MTVEGMENVEMIAGKKHAPKFLGRVLILGLGKSGTAAAEYCLDVLGSRVEALAVAAGAPGEAALAWAEGAREKRGAVVLFDHETIEGTYDLCIASPGISENSPFYRSAAAASSEVISEVEFAWRESDASSKWVAITGTNGKNHHRRRSPAICWEAGMNAAAVGNIGETCIDAVAAGNTDVYVAETSSYQLASTRLFAPDVVVVLNITPDHLSWHGSLEAYAAAKWKVLANLGASGGVAVLDACDDAVRAKIRELRARGGVPFRYIPIGGAAGLGADMRATCGADAAAFRGAGGQLVVAWDGHVSDLVFVDDLQIKGGHNQQNALAAAACALVLGATDTAVGEGLLTFRPLEHRIEPAGLVDGVACYNDSKATNVDAHAGGAHRLSTDAPHRAARRPRQGHRFGPPRGGLRRERPGRGLLRRGPRAVPSGFRGLGGLPGALRRHDGGGAGRGPLHRRGRGRGRALAGLRLLRRV